MAVIQASLLAVHGEPLMAVQRAEWSNVRLSA